MEHNPKTWAMHALFKKAAQFSTWWLWRASWRMRCQKSKPVCATQPSQIAGPIHSIQEENRETYIAMLCVVAAVRIRTNLATPAGASRRRAGAFPRRAGAIRHPAGASRRRAGVFPRRAGAIRHREEEVSWQTFPACTACVNFVDNAAIEIDKIVTPHKPGSIGSCGSIENVYCLDYIMNDLLYLLWKWMM